MKRQGFGAIDLLIGLLLMTVVFFIGTSAFKGVSIMSSKQGAKSVKEHVDKTVDEIENMRNESINYQKQMLENND